MTRKHYRQVANIVAGHLLVAESSEERKGIEDMARAMARMFKADNHNFDFERFYTACGL